MATNDWFETLKSCKSVCHGRGIIRVQTNLAEPSVKYSEMRQAISRTDFPSTK
jgi:hypothetical protein